MKRVSYIFPTSHHYRAPFHEALRSRLSAYGIDYTVIYCDPSEENQKKKDTVEIPWGRKVKSTRLPGGLLYQHGMRDAIKSNLVIVQQENRLLLNYILNIASMLGIKKVAYFGHGRNFQARDPDSRAERWKKLWAKKVDWWFGYTDATRNHVASLGFPIERITVFNNAVDTSKTRELVKNVTQEDLINRRRDLGILDDNVGVFVGGLYADKRLEFLVDASDIIREKIPSFTLIVVGGGNQLPTITKASEARPWIKVMGPRFGAEKVELMMLGKAFLMPGLVGLAVLDAGAAGLPIITTAFPYHSPEIAYIEEGKNGSIIQDWESPRAYADAVVDLLHDPSRQLAMSEAAREMASRLSIEAMADNFARGVLQALAA